MKDLFATLTALRRPRLLIRAARFGISDYNRDRDLKRMLRLDCAPSPDRALNRLIEEEARIETNRRTDTSTYSVTRHIELLIAIMAEARLLPR